MALPIVQASTQELLVGRDVSQRPWFLHGRDGPWLEDLHDAPLLKDKVTSPDGEPVRFIDVSAPVYNQHGELVGVIGAHLFWAWARDIEQSVMGPERGQSQVEVFILNQAREILLGPPNVRGPWLDATEYHTAATTGHDKALGRDGTMYLTGFSRCSGYRESPGLGWTVVVRQDSAHAYRPVGALKRSIQLWGSIFGLGFGLLGWGIARRVTQPVRAITAAAERMQHGYRHLTFPLISAPTEVARLSSVLRNLLTSLTTQEVALQAANATLEQRVRERTLALEKANQQLEELSQRDALTRLYNRRVFNSRLEAECVRAVRYHTPLSLILLDIDHFKRLNDTYGHRAGDAVLVQVACLLQQHARATDLVERFGGAEFAVVVTNRALDGAALLAERLRRAFHTADWDYGAVTASFGVAVVWGEMSEPDELIEQADQALYRSKQSGRDRLTTTDVLHGCRHELA